MPKRKPSTGQRAKLAGIKRTGKTVIPKVPGKTKFVKKVLDRPKIQEVIIERMIQGELVIHICEDIGISQWTLYNMIDTDEAFAKSYARARRLQSHAIAQNIQDLSDGLDPISLKKRQSIEIYAKQLQKNGVKDWRKRIKDLERNLIARNRLQVDARKWYAKTLNPATYGDKVDVTSGDKPLEPSSNSNNSLTVQFVRPDGKAKGSPD